MKNLIYTILSFFYLPIVFFLYLTQDKNLFKEDLIAWAKWKKKTPNLLGASRIFTNCPEYRDLLYHRSRPYSFLISWLFKGRTALYITTEKIGGGFKLLHPFATVINAESIGRNVAVFQQVTIGMEKGKKPIIHDNVTICCGAKVIGGCTIGSNVIIGANAVVVKDVPDNSVVGGVPAKVIKKLPPLSEQTEMRELD